MKTKLQAISAAVLLAMAAAAPAHAALERVGPISNAPDHPGFPEWFQDTTGITMEYCNLSTQAEWDGGWCLLALPDGPEGGLPEVFPDNFFEEHFYFDATNVLLDDAFELRARLVIALEAIPDGGQTVFARHRIDMRPLPFDGDYRIITPYFDTTYKNQAAGERIFDTQDIGIGCPHTFECTLTGAIGPFLLPSATAGGAEVPPMPDLANSPPGTDPFYDQMLALNGGGTAAPGTGKKYIADPARVGAITGSPLPDVTVYDIDNSATPNTKGIPRQQNHNTFRVEVRSPSADGNGDLLYVMDGTTNFSLMGRLMTGLIPGRVDGGRAVYRADAAGNATDIDVFTSASPTLQARIPAQPIQGVVKPLLEFYPEPCGGAISLDADGNPVVNPGPYTAPANSSPISLVNDEGSSDYWAQVAVSGPPPSHVCIVNTNARDANGQVIPAYMLRAVTDDVVIRTANYNGPQDGMLSVTADSSDPTATLTLAGFGSTPEADGSYRGRGPGAQLAGNAVTVKGIKAPPNAVQVVSSKGGSNMHKVETARGMAVTAGQVVVGNVTASVTEDCGAETCASGQQIDLLANSTVLLNGQTVTLRDAIAAGETATVTVVQGARLGTATVSADGFLSYAPAPNASGIDGITFTVSLNGGPASDPATVNITVTPVNDAPVAGNTTIQAVQSVSMSINLIANATDPDGVSDVKTAVITSWPVELGPQPVPVNGSITIAPSLIGNYTFGYKVVDAAGVQSENDGVGTVTVIAGETITINRAQIETDKIRWRVDGTDTIRSSQTISITFANGTLSRGPNAGQTCDGTDRIPECTIGTTGVTATGTWALDSKFGSSSFQNPATAGGWSVPPTRIRAWSSNPVLGGGAEATISRKN